MAFFGTISDLARLLENDDRFRPAFDYLLRCQNSQSPDAKRIGDLIAGPAHRHDLEQGSVAFEETYPTRDRANCFYESHRKYIDVQCVLAGEERVDVLPAAELSVEKPYREEKDLIKYGDAGPGSQIHLCPGQAAIFFPEDGHMPGQHVHSVTWVRKTVVKVPVQPEGHF